MKHLYLCLFGLLCLAQNNVFGTTLCEETFYTENFENYLSINEFRAGQYEWIVENPGTGYTWEVDNLGTFSEPDRALVLGTFIYSFSGTPEGSINAIISPSINLVNRTNAKMNFDYHYSMDVPGVQSDSLMIYVSSDGGQTFNDLAFSIAEEGNNNFLTSAELAGEWCTEGNCMSVDLSAYAGYEDVKVKIEIISYNHGYFAIDNVDVTSDCYVESAAPAASIQVDKISNCIGGEFSFMDMTSSETEILSREWFFPGGNPSSSTEDNPIVTYDSLGTYNVKMIVRNVGGVVDTSFADFVHVVLPAAPFFEVEVDLLEVSFINWSSYGISYEWDFGDGNTSTEETPSHTYSVDGTYTISLTAFNDCATNVHSTEVTVVSIPQANISSNETEGCSPMEIQFTDESSLNTSNWQWVFPGGMPENSNQQNPVVTYNAAGQYDIRLIASNDAGADTIEFVNYILIEEGPISNFTYADNELEVDFTNTSNNAVSYSWDFGDGNTSTEESPNHIFTEPGTYTVQLTSTNPCGNEVASQEITVDVNTSVFEVPNQFKISLSPNPTPGQLNIKVLDGNISESTLSIYNTKGELVKQEFFKQANSSLGLETSLLEFSDGIYLVNFRSNGHSFTTTVILKK